MGVVPAPGPAPGAKPPGSNPADKHTNKPSKPLNGSSGASAGAAAAGAAAAGTSPWGAWGAAAQKHLAELKVKADTAAQDWQKQAKNFKWPKKWEMPVHVDVDVIGPQMETLKNTAIEVWDGLPPPAQRYLPYIASSGVASFITYKLQRKRVQLERQRNERLRDKVAALTQENEALTEKLDRARKQPGITSDTELRMAAAVAKATQAAAQASNAAAHAAEVATACVISRGRPPPAPAA